MTIPDNIVRFVEERLCAFRESFSNGKDGANGKDGTNGSNGTNGTNGIDGKDGANGKDGTNGTNGTNGIDGKNGKDAELITAENFTEAQGKVVAGKRAIVLIKNNALYGSPTNSTFDGTDWYHSPAQKRNL